MPPLGGHIWYQIRRNNPFIPGSHLQPSPGWQSRCDLFILAISFPFLLILFHSLSSPLNPPTPVPSLSTSSHLSHPHPPTLSLASFPPFLLTFFFIFYCSSSHTPSCCSKSLKGTELIGAVAMVIEALARPAGLWVGWADIQSGCTKFKSVMELELDVEEYVSLPILFAHMFSTLTGIGRYGQKCYHNNVFFTSFDIDNYLNKCQILILFKFKG